MTATRRLLNIQTFNHDAPEGQGIGIRTASTWRQAPPNFYYAGEVKELCEFLLEFFPEHFPIGEARP